MSLTVLRFTCANQTPDEPVAPARPLLIVLKPRHVTGGHVALHGVRLSSQSVKGPAGKVSLVFAAVMFLSAFLLFVVQPMVAKAFLPILGGGTGVWTTCMLFFQLALLAGYASTHWAAGRLSPRVHFVAHVLVLTVALVASWSSLGAPAEVGSGSPIPWLLVALVSSIGLPFFVLATTAPLVQTWYSRTGASDAADPYFLYAASNAGSMLALVSYPFLIEPIIGLTGQETVWNVGFTLFCVILTACGVWLHAAPRVDLAVHLQPPRAGEEISRLRILRWVVWALLPSSLMLGVTQYITTDIASIPLLWVLPLALYLLSFILAFSKKARRIPVKLVQVLPFVVLAVTCEFGVDPPQFLIMGLHLVVLFVFSLLFHGFLADDRPEANQVTRYFLWVSVGGALGGIAHGLIAPWIFDRPIEYALALALAIAILPVQSRDPFRPHYAPYFVASAGTAYLFAVDVFEVRVPIFGLAALLALGVFWLTRRYPRAVYWMLSLIFLIGVVKVQTTRGALGHERSFFGSYKIFERTWNGATVRKFSHGTTSHGSQALGERLRRKPLSYHHRAGPVGEIFEKLEPGRVGVVGLGAGAMAAYANADTQITFYEIDPLVDRIAQTYFWYLSDCGDRCDVKLGDGRLLLEREAEHTFDLLFLDAYNSDSVPTHLLSREALRLYVRRVKPKGGIVFHVSNRYLDVQSVVGALAQDATMTCLARTHFPTRSERKDGAMTSSYAVVGRGAWMSTTFGSKWKPCRADAPVWTDDFSNVMHVFKWR
jgi:hypothetical protein